MTTSARAHLPAKKRFGQHFLEPAWAAKVVHALAPTADDTFLEIGPGRGAITVPLAAAVRHVVGFEIDRDLASRLRDRAPANLRIVEGDFLETTASDIRAALEHLERPTDGLRVAGNLPYNVASPILFRLVDLFEDGLPLVDATVMLQREVANRLLASPGTKDYGVLTMLLGHNASVERLLQLPAGAFRPAPKVQSSVVRLRFHARAPEVRDARVFRALTQAVFTRRRKTLANALLAYPPLADGSALAMLLALGLDPQRRPETLTIPEMAQLSDLVAAARGR